MQIAKWGNSLAVRLPAELVRELGLREGDHVTLKPVRGRSAKTDGHAIELRREASRAEWLQSLGSLNWQLPLDYRFDREEANERAGHR